MATLRADELVMTTLTLMAGAGVQVVWMGDGDAGEGLEGGIAEHAERTFGQLFGGRPGELAVQAVELDQPCHVGRGVAVLERLSWRAAPVNDLPVLLPSRKARTSSNDFRGCVFRVTSILQG